MAEISPFQELLDYRRKVSELNGWLRNSDLEAGAGCQEFHRRRDILFVAHPRSALTDLQRGTFS